MRKFLILAAGLVAGGFSTSLYADSLADALEAAWTADPEWSAALNTWEAGQENKNLGRAGLLPNVGAQYSWMDNRFKDLRSRDSFDFEAQTLTLTAAQPLFRMEAWHAYKQGDAATTLAEAEFSEARQQFFHRIATSYFDVLRAWENLNSAMSEEKAIREQLDQSKERYDVGLIAMTDVHEAEAAYDLAQANVIMYQSEFDINRDKLEALTGRNWDKMATLLEDLPLNPPEPSEPQKWQELAQGQNPGLLAVKQQSEVLRQSAKQDASKHLPTVDLVAQYQRYRDDTDSAVGGGGASMGRAMGRNETTAYGIEVNMPLFQGGGINSKRKQSALEHAASKDTYRQTWRDVGQQTLAAYRQVSANSSNIKARKQSIRSAKSALEATEAGYDVGTRNIVEVLDAQRTLFAAKRDYANARYDYIINSLNLKALAGALTERDLQQVNEWLSDVDEVNLNEIAQDSGQTSDS